MKCFFLLILIYYHQEMFSTQLSLRNSVNSKRWNGWALSHKQFTSSVPDNNTQWKKHLTANVTKLVYHIYTQNGKTANRLTCTPKRKTASSSYNSVWFLQLFKTLNIVLSIEITTKGFLQYLWPWSVFVNQRISLTKYVVKYFYM